MDIVYDVWTDSKKVFVEVLHVDGLDFFVNQLDLFEEENWIRVDIQELEYFVQLLKLIEENLELHREILFGGLSNHLKPLQVSDYCSEIHVKNK